MALANSNDLPDVGAVLGGVLARVDPELHPLVVAMAERLAAERYERWAQAPALEAWKTALLDCARREVAIAAQVESLYADVAERLAAIHRAVPDLEDVNRDLFAGLDLEQQITLQAGAERLGAATWRAFADAAKGSTADTLRACSPLEVKSAEVLDAILADGFGSSGTGAA